MSKPDRVFRALLRLLPAEFRGEYEREMTAAFRAERQAAGSPGGLLRLWLATLADLVRTAPREHLDILTRDVSYTVRMLVRRPTLTLTAILTLALGIGANTAIFSVVNGVVFAPLPYPDAERLVLVQEHGASEEPGTTGYLSFDALRRDNQTFESLSAFAGWSAVLSVRLPRPARVNCRPSLDTSLGAKLTENSPLSRVRLFSSERLNFASMFMANLNASSPSPWNDPRSESWAFPSGELSAA